MEKLLSPQEIVKTVTQQLELIKLADEVLNPSAQEKQATVAQIFRQLDRMYKEGNINQQIHEQLVNLWLDNYPVADTSTAKAN